MTKLLHYERQVICRNSINLLFGSLVSDDISVGPSINKELSGLNNTFWTSRMSGKNALVCFSKGYYKNEKSPCLCQARNSRFRPSSAPTGEYRYRETYRDLYNLQVRLDRETPASVVLRSQSVIGDAMWSCYNIFVYVAVHTFDSRCYVAPG